ncbi:MAG: M48 family metallopeptidase [Candidatus Nanohaloarchaea archaeon]
MMLEDQIARNHRRSYLLMLLVPAILVSVIFVAGRIFAPGISPFMVLAVGSLVSVVYVLYSYFRSDKMVLKSTGAEKAPESSYSQYHDLVEGLSISSGAPKPELYVKDSDAINAFATGRKPEDGKICVTTGALEKLEKDELEGVLAHELAHIRNHDTLFMTVAVALIGMVSILSELILDGLFFGVDDDTPPWALAAGIALAIMAPISARLVQLAMSRKREYLADASGAKMTRYPEGLASALEKIEAQSQRMEANRAVSHLYMSNPLDGSELFSTHPPTQERINRLREM